MKLQLITLVSASLLFFAGCSSSSDGSSNTKVKVSSDFYIVNADVRVGDSNSSTYLGDGTYELDGEFVGVRTVIGGVNDVNGNGEADTGESYAPMLSAPDTYANVNPFTTMLVNGTLAADLGIKYPVAYGIKDNFDFDVVAESTDNIDLAKEVANASLELSGS